MVNQTCRYIHIEGDKDLLLQGTFYHRFYAKVENEQIFATIDTLWNHYMQTSGTQRNFRNQLP